MAKIRESNAARRERAEQILTLLEQAYPESRIALNYETPFQLLVATILAAQCTDVRVNLTTPALFERYPSPQAFIDASQEELEKQIFMCGFYRNKAKMIKGASHALVERFGGEVPRTMDELLTIPGLGRKSSNVILGHCFDVPGVVVDTHVTRIANLLGLVDNGNAEKIEQALMPLFPKEKWIKSGHLIQDLGRAICIARSPKCGVCMLATICPSAGAAERAKAETKGKAAAKKMAMREAAAKKSAAKKAALAKKEAAKKEAAKTAKTAAAAAAAKKKGNANKSANTKPAIAKSPTAATTTAKPATAATAATTTVKTAKTTTVKTATTNTSTPGSTRAKATKQSTATSTKPPSTSAKR